MPVLIERRFCGPPNSAQGGYTCGLVAERIEADCAAVTLRLPPPLEESLELEEREDGTVALIGSEGIVAEGAPAQLQLEIPSPPSLEEARAASAGSPWEDVHPFPGCFGCGPRRSQDEAVAIRTGPVGDSVFAGVWTPLPEFAGESRFTWAALDCPTAAPAVPLDAAPSVLGRLTACLVEPVRAGEPHIVTAWLVGHDGRKHTGAAAIHTAEGELCAFSQGLWIELRDPAAMGAKAR